MYQTSNPSHRSLEEEFTYIDLPPTLEPLTMPGTYSHRSSEIVSQDMLRGQSSDSDRSAQFKQDADDDASKSGEPRGLRFYGAVGTLCLMTFIIALDSTIITVALSTIAEDIHASAIQAFWCGTSFLLASTVIQPPVASLSHIFGRQPVMLSSLTVFTVGTIVAAVAKHIETLLVGRTLQGLGSGGILALTYVIMTDLVSLRERGKWFGFISLSWAIGSILGPPVGGALVEVSWPWLFWINLPFCAIAYVGVPLTMRIKRKETRSAKEKLKEFDWIGTIIFVGSLTSFLMPMSWGGVMFDWDSPRTVVPLVVGIVGLIAFAFHICFHSMYSRCDPLLRPSIFKSLTSDTAFLGTVIHGIIIWCQAYYIPLYHEARGSTPLNAGIALLPYTGAVAPSAIVVGLLITRRGTYRHLIWAGWVLLAINNGLLMLLEEDTPTWEWVLIYLVGGFGLGILYSAQAFAAQVGASNGDLPFAASMYAFCRSLGQGIGVALGGVMFQNEFQKQIEKSEEFGDKAAEWSRDASALVQTIRKATPEMQAMKDTIVNGYIDALWTIWLVLCILACTGLVVAVLGIKDKSLDRKFETEHGFQEKERNGGRDSARQGEV